MTEDLAPRKPGALGVLWRFLLFFGASIVAATLGATILSSATGISGKISISFDSLPGVLIGVIAVVLATWAMLHTEKGIGWSSLYLDRPALGPRKIGLGLLVGAFGIGIPSALLLISDELVVIPATAGSWIEAAAFDIAFFVLAAAMEELVVRGYLFSLLRRQWGIRTALVATSLVFGALHLLNPGAGAESIVNVTLAGFFLGGVLILTESLYAAIAAHFAWNWTMSALFHSAVSGASIPAPNYTTIDNGPDWLTGGPWGPEGGAAATAAMIIVIFFLFRRRHLRTVES